MWYLLPMSKVKITFWGVRGSVAAPGPSTVKYGGNTACVEIDTGKELLVCDGGTGIRPLGLKLKRSSKAPVKAFILLTHLHWDHYVGLPFFAPFYDSRNKFVVAGPNPPGQTFKKALSFVMRPPYFPIPISAIPARLEVKSIDDKPIKMNSVLVVPFKVNHPGGAFGWRFYFENGRSIVHITDNEPLKFQNEKKFVDWMRGADVLIHDAQYTPTSYDKHVGWGHSPYTYPIKLAAVAGIKRVFLFHFDPEDDDKHLDTVRKKVLSIGKGLGIACDLAREGLSINLEGR